MVVQGGTVSHYYILVIRKFIGFISLFWHSVWFSFSLKQFPSAEFGICNVQLPMADKYCRRVELSSSVLLQTWQWKQRILWFTRDIFTSWKEANPTCKNVSNRNHKLSLKPHLHALKNRYGTPKFWHHANDFKARHSQFLTCKCIGPKCNLAPVLKILGVPRLPHGGSLGTGKRGTVPKIWRAVLIF